MGRVVTKVQQCVVLVHRLCKRLVEEFLPNHDGYYVTVGVSASGAEMEKGIADPGWLPGASNGDSMLVYIGVGYRCGSY